MEDPGIIAIRRVFSFLYEIYFELNCSACNSDNVTLTQVMLKNGLERSGESNIDENLIEWIPGLLGSGVCCVDQLTLWLIDIVNISLVWLFVSLVSGLVVDWLFTLFTLFTPLVAFIQRAESHEMQKSAAVEH